MYKLHKIFCYLNNNVESRDLTNRARPAKIRSVQHTLHRINFIKVK